MQPTENNQQATDERPVESCPAGDDNCPHLPELNKLRSEVKELSAQVSTDDLTGLFNFRYFNQALGLEMERTRRSGQPTCLIMCDLDHFKSINDVHGHEVGNTVLGHASGLIRQTVRRLDIPCRYGGEEFVIILPNTALEQGVRFANRLRLVIENTPIKVGDISLGIAASFGVDIYSRGKQLSENQFVEKVDGFLYQAKQQGRNRVCHEDFEAQEGVSVDEKAALLGMFPQEKD
jgi:diguanylate cyclase (GGDEF)-like protein